MAKKNDYYICTECGTAFSKWAGQCRECSQWNTIVESYNPNTSLVNEKPEAVSLSSVELKQADRIYTDIDEFNLVCGGGIVPGSLILIGGEPGIGKSTIALQISGFFNTLYISGEESPQQIRQRAERINIDIGKIKISTSTDINSIISLAVSETPGCIIIDSIQTLRSSEIPGVAGSVSQIRETASKLALLSKKIGITIVIIGHITKDGTIAGPKVLEHLVDTVLYFEGDFSKEFRILRSFKNRYGSVNELGLFRMTEKGLLEVKEKNRMFLNNFSTTAPGNAVSASAEGSRSILFEVQALVTFSTFPNPRRMADGLDINRLIIITAVLERHTGIKLNSFASVNTELAIIKIYAAVSQSSFFA